VEDALCEDSGALDGQLSDLELRGVRWGCHGCKRSL
jgi:hypothetical protein